MKIKSIKENDKNIFKELSKEFYASGATINPYNDETNEKTFRYLTSAHHNLFGYLIISDDGNCAGYSLLTSYWCNEEGGEIIIIDELYVKKSIVSTDTQNTLSAGRKTTSKDAPSK